MERFSGRWMVALLLLGLSGCANLSSSPKAASLVGIDGIACVGDMPVTPAEATDGGDAGVLQQALAASGKGGLCAGKVVTAQRALRVYRVWDSSKAYTEKGRWWSLTRPQGPREQYQHDYAICPDWSALDRLVACDVKPASSLAIGLTQSADCGGEIYPKTAAEQVFLPNDGQNQVFWVENCQDEGLWP